MKSVKSLMGLISIATATRAASFTKQWGGTGNEFLSATTSSSTGDICVSGRWANLATTDIGGITLTNSDSGASDEVLVAKMDKDGDVKWAKSWGNANEAERAVTAFDSSGNIGVSGLFTGASMTIAGMSVSGSATEQYAYVAKLDSSGNAVWASSFGSSTTNEEASAMAVTFDASGNLYVSGSFEGTITLGGTSYTSAGGVEGIVIKYTSTGTVDRAFQWGGAQDESGQDIKVDGDGNVYVLGFSSSTSTSATTLTIGTEQFSGAATPSGVTQYSVLFKLDTSFAVLWAKQIGGAESKSQTPAVQLQLDSSNNVYVVGVQNAVSTTIGTTTLTGAGLTIAAGYAASFTSAGAFRWATNLVGSAATLFRACTLSDDGYYLRIAGLLGSASLTVGSSTLTLQGIRDCMIATLDAATGEWVGASSIGQSGGMCSADAIAYPSTDTLVVSGWFSGGLTSFRGTSLTPVGGFDIYVEQFDTSALGIASKSKKTDTSTSSSKSSKTEALSDGGIAGIVIALAVLLVVIAILVARKQKQQQQQQDQASELPVVVGQGGGLNAQGGASLS